MHPKLSNDTRIFKIWHSYDPVEPFEVDLFLFFCQFFTFFRSFFDQFLRFSTKKIPLYHRFTQNHWLNSNSEHCVGKAWFWNYEAIPDFLNYYHFTTLWSHLKSTNIQVFRLFRDYCWNSSFFRFALAIEFVNLQALKCATEA